VKIPRRGGVIFYFRRSAGFACRAGDSQVLVRAFGLSRCCDKKIHAQKNRVAAAWKSLRHGGFRGLGKILSSKNRGAQIFLTAL
jgi:hypothetical protein